MDIVDLPLDISITEFICRRFQGYENNVALIDGETGESLKYGEVRRHVSNISAGLVRLGLRKGDVVATVAPNNAAHLTVILAIPAVGGIFSGINPAYTPVEIERQLIDSTASMIIVSEEVLHQVKAAVKRCPNVKNIIVLGKSEEYPTIKNMASMDAMPPPVEINADDDIAFLPYSSGTTGTPKGVMITHKAAMMQLALFYDNKDFCLVDHGSCLLSVFPFFHIGGWMFLSGSLYQQSTFVMMAKFDFERCLHSIQKYKVEKLVIPPPVAIRLTKDPLVNKYDISSLKFILVGAAPLAAGVQQELTENFNIHVRQAYGMTETAGATHCAKRWGPPVYGSAGNQHPHIPTKIMDVKSGLELVRQGEVGEVLVRTWGLKAYWRDPDKTRLTLDQDGFIHTGDIGYIDNGGNLFIVDRVKELIKYKGFQVAPAELEALLLTHEDVADAAVIGLEDTRAGEVPAAFIVLKPDRKTTKQDIQTFVAERAAPYKHLRGGVSFLDEIPKTASGKILRRLLRQKHSKKKPFDKMSNL